MSANRSMLHRLACVVVVVAATLVGSVEAVAKGLQSGAVYVMTNQRINAIQAYERAPDGSLTPAGIFSTGGAGDPVAQPGDPPSDPLASQGALVLNASGRLLFAVNAGSNEISVLSVNRDGLELVDKIGSGGVRPISVTVYGDLLYVLNEGGTPNITGFSVGSGGRLSPLPGSTRTLIGGAGADPAQVSFSSDGSLLVVTEKKTNMIDTYSVGDDGLATGPMSNASFGATPFGFAFDHDNRLVVSEAMGGAIGGSAASSYTVAPNDLLIVKSGSVRNGQTASCWTVITNNGYAYISNTGSGTISSYRVLDSGALSLVDGAAASGGATSFPIDIALDNGSRHLYVLEAGTRAVASFDVNADGSLTPIAVIGGLPFGSQGIAAR